MPPVPDVLSPPASRHAGVPTAALGARHAPALPPERPQLADYLDLFILGAGLALAGLAALRSLAIEWSVNAQYSYGWTVPWLALFLLFRQWTRRPVARPPAPGSNGRRVALSAGAGLLLLQLPLRWVQVANPDWRPLAWVTTGVFIALALLAAFLLGGRRWVRAFAFPFCFCSSRCRGRNALKSPACNSSCAP